MSDTDRDSQDEIESLLRQSQQSGVADPTPVTESAAGNADPDPTTVISQSDIDSLLSEAQEAIASLDEPPATLPPGVRPFELKSLGSHSASNEPATLDLIRDVQLDLRIELGRTHMHLDEVLCLKQGAVVTLDKLAGDPVDIYANGRLIARGEVLVLNDNFCVRVAELVTGEVHAA